MYINRYLERSKKLDRKLYWVKIVKLKEEGNLKKILTSKKYICFIRNMYVLPINCLNKTQLNIAIKRHIWCRSEPIFYFILNILPFTNFRARI